MFIIRLAAEALSIADVQSPAPSDKGPPTLKPNNNFLYNLLTGHEDFSAAQQRSQLCLGPQQKPRSNSVIVHRPKIVCPKVDDRPSSVPHPNYRYTPYSLGKRNGTMGRLHPRPFPSHQRLNFPITQSQQHDFDSSALSTSTDSGLDEPLDLTKPIPVPRPHHSLHHHHHPLHEPTDLPSDDSESSKSSPPLSCNPLRLPAPTTSPQDVADEGTEEVEFVQLARKTAIPVQSRVTDWLRQMVALLRSSDPESGSDRLGQLPLDLRLRLLQHSWHRVLVLYMAEHNLRIVTSPNHSPPSPPASQQHQPTVLPTRKFVEQLEDLINLCSSLALDAPTFNLIRIALILIGPEQSMAAENLDLLQAFLMARDCMVDLRQVMGKLFSISQAQMEALFCGHLGESAEQVLRRLFFTEY